MKNPYDRQAVSNRRGHISAEIPCRGARGAENDGRGHKHLIAVIYKKCHQVPDGKQFYEKKAQPLGGAFSQAARRARKPPSAKARAVQSPPARPL